MTRTIARFAFAVVAASFFASTAEAQWGTLKGKFVLDGPVPEATKLVIDKDPQVCGQHNLVDEALVVDPNGGIGNVVVYLRTKGAQVHPDFEKEAGARATLDNKNCRFDPHVLGMQISQTLVLKNSDPVGHNSNVQPIGDQPANPLIPAGAEVEHKFNRAQLVPVPVTCNIHPWMKAWILPRDNPYIAVSAKDGTFEIKNLPVGELEFQAWQEKSGYLAVGDWARGRFTMTIKEGDNDLGTIKVPADLFNK